MNNVQTIIDQYLDFCQYQKRLNTKTLKAYRIDLKQFSSQLTIHSFSTITPDILEAYISMLHKTYQPKTVKRKIASIKALFHYLEYKNIIQINPFNKILLKFREPLRLPKIIPLHTIETFLSVMYTQKQTVSTPLQKKCIIRDIAVIELLFATGIRISELCSLRPSNINLYEQNILIYGKGSKERRLQIGNDDTIRALKEYQFTYQQEIQDCGYFFVNRLHHRLSEQSVREMINKYTSLAAINLHITPHMFRHSFATYLLEADVDIRYIQEMLGHSSISVTQIYTHVAMAKQKDILTTKHPRKNFKL
ncbi:MAG: tyrosine-type recombinase/integrase [Lachnospiraceae bacterium]|nr:tyrosine-type recombinase/integrase [Lachnospiraceae bacterium]